MLTVKATFRKQTRKLSFDSDTFPSYHELIAQLYRIFSLPPSTHPTLHKVLFSPNAPPVSVETGPNRHQPRVLVSRKVTSADDWERCLRPFAGQNWRCAVLWLDVEVGERTGDNYNNNNNMNMNTTGGETSGGNDDSRRTSRLSTASFAWSDSTAPTAASTDPLRTPTGLTSADFDAESRQFYHDVMADRRPDLTEEQVEREREAENNRAREEIRRMWDEAVERRRERERVTVAPFEVPSWDVEERLNAGFLSDPEREERRKQSDAMLTRLSARYGIQYPEPEPASDEEKRAREKETEEMRRLIYAQSGIQYPPPEPRSDEEREASRRKSDEMLARLEALYGLDQSFDDGGEDDEATLGGVDMSSTTSSASTAAPSHDQPSATINEPVVPPSNIQSNGQPGLTQEDTDRFLRREIAQLGQEIKSTAAELEEVMRERGMNGPLPPPLAELLRGSRQSQPGMTPEQRSREMRREIDRLRENIRRVEVGAGEARRGRGGVTGGPIDVASAAEGGTGANAARETRARRTDEMLARLAAHHDIPRSWSVFDMPPVSNLTFDFSSATCSATLPLADLQAQKRRMSRMTPEQMAQHTQGELEQVREQLRGLGEERRQRGDEASSTTTGSPFDRSFPPIQGELTLFGPRATNVENEYARDFLDLAEGETLDSSRRDFTLRFGEMVRKMAGERGSANGGGTPSAAVPPSAENAPAVEIVQDANHHPRAKSNAQPSTAASKSFLAHVYSMYKTAPSDANKEEVYKQLRVQYLEMRKEEKGRRGEKGKGRADDVPLSDSPNLAQMYSWLRDAPSVEGREEANKEMRKIIIEMMREEIRRPGPKKTVSTGTVAAPKSAENVEGAASAKPSLAQLRALAERRTRVGVPGGDQAEVGLPTSPPPLMFSPPPPVMFSFPPAAQPARPMVDVYRCEPRSVEPSPTPAPHREMEGGKEDGNERGNGNPTATGNENLSGNTSAETHHCCSVARARADVREMMDKFLRDVERVKGEFEDKEGEERAVPPPQPLTIVRAPSPAPIYVPSPTSSSEPEQVPRSPVRELQMHTGIQCDACGELPIMGVGYKCADCQDYDLCEPCLTIHGAAESHNPFHIFREVNAEAPAQQERVERVRVRKRVVHLATCDLCDSNIVGDRYKCLNCPDFDLCSDCFTISNEQHPQHGFVRVERPEVLMVRNGRNLGERHLASCDGCQKWIFGTRYKCMHPDCPDFDLCQNCEALPIAVHPPNHPMVKLYKAETMIPEVFRNDRVEQLERRIREELAQEMSRLREEVEDLKEEKQDIAVQVVELREGWMARVQANEALERDLTDARAAEAEARASEAEARERASEAMRQLSDARAEAVMDEEPLQEEIAGLQAALSGAVGDAEELREEVAILRAQMEGFMTGTGSSSRGDYCPSYDGSSRIYQRPPSPPSPPPVIPGGYFVPSRSTSPGMYTPVIPSPVMSSPYRPPSSWLPMQPSNDASATCLPLYNNRFSLNLEREDVTSAESRECRGSGWYVPLRPRAERPVGTGSLRRREKMPANADDRQDTLFGTFERRMSDLRRVDSPCPVTRERTASWLAPSSWDGVQGSSGSARPQSWAPARSSSPMTVRQPDEVPPPMLPTLQPESPALFGTRSFMSNVCEPFGSRSPRSSAVYEELFGWPLPARPEGREDADARLRLPEVINTGLFGPRSPDTDVGMHVGWSSPPIQSADGDLSTQEECPRSAPCVIQVTPVISRGPSPTYAERSTSSSPAPETRGETVVHSANGTGSPSPMSSAPRIPSALGGKDTYKDLWPAVASELMHLLQPQPEAPAEESQDATTAVNNANAASTSTLVEGPTAVTTGSSPLGMQPLLSRPTNRDAAVDLLLRRTNSLATLLSRASPSVSSQVPTALATSDTGDSARLSTVSASSNASLRAMFINDNNIPDGQVFPPGAEFVKSWCMMNDGEIAWPESTNLVFVAGHQLGATVGRFHVGWVPAGAQTIVWTGELKAPEYPGQYVSYWRLSDGQGNQFGHSIWVDITVALPAQSEGSSNRTSLASSSIVMPRSAGSNSPVPSDQARALQQPSSAQTASLTVPSSPTDVNDYDHASVGSSASLLSVPSDEEEDGSSEGVWEDTREEFGPEQAPRQVSETEYVVLYETSSDEE